MAGTDGVTAETKPLPPSTPAHTMVHITYIYIYIYSSSRSMHTILFGIAYNVEPLLSLATKLENHAKMKHASAITPLRRPGRAHKLII